MSFTSTQYPVFIIFDFLITTTSLTMIRIISVGFFLKSAIPMILDTIISPSGKQLTNKTPTIANNLMSFKNDLIFFLCPLLLTNMRI